MSSHTLVVESSSSSDDIAMVDDHFHHVENAAIAEFSPMLDDVSMIVDPPVQVVTTESSSSLIDPSIEDSHAVEMVTENAGPTDLSIRRTKASGADVQNLSNELSEFNILDLNISSKGIWL